MHLVESNLKQILNWKKKKKLKRKIWDAAMPAEIKEQ